MTRNIADQRSVEKDAKSLKVQRAKRRDQLRFMLTNEPSRLYLAEVIRESHALNTMQVAEGPTLLPMREGMRAVGLKILNDVQALAPEQFAPLIKAVMTPNVIDGDKDDGPESDPE